MKKYSYLIIVLMLLVNTLKAQQTFYDSYEVNSITDKIDYITDIQFINGQTGFLTATWIQLALQI